MNNQEEHSFRTKIRDIPTKDAYIHSNCMLYNGDGVLISQETYFNLCNSDNEKDMLKVVYSFADKPARKDPAYYYNYSSNKPRNFYTINDPEPLGNGFLCLTRNGQDVSLFDLDDNDFMKVIKHLPKMDEKCLENTKLLQRFLCVDLFNGGLEKVEKLKMLDNAFKKGYVSAGIVALNYRKTCGQNEEKDTCQQIDAILAKKDGLEDVQDKKNLKILCKMNKELKEEALTNSGEDLLTQYFMKKNNAGWLNCAWLATVAAYLVMTKMILSEIPFISFICAKEGSDKLIEAINKITSRNSADNLMLRIPVNSR